MDGSDPTHGVSYTVEKGVSVNARVGQLLFAPSRLLILLQDDLQIGGYGLILCAEQREARLDI